MTEVAKTLPAHPCATCEKPPLIVFVKGSKQHYCECPRCGTRTARHSSDADAIAAWSAKATQPMQIAAVPSPTTTPAPLRRVA